MKRHLLVTEFRVTNRARAQSPEPTPDESFV